jgi:uncharacterized protein YbjT (DUF2867 family)
MRVAVVGGTGTLGASLVAELVRRGEEVRGLSRRPGTALPAGASHAAIDLASGEGLGEALAGSEVVVDAANARKRAGEVLVEGTKRLLEAEVAAGVRHHLLISIVGCDRVPMGYYRVKTAQEEVVAGGPLPWTLLRATQFHPLLAGVFEGAARWRLRLSGAARLQPIDVGVVAARLADAAQAEPAGRLPGLAGPEVKTLGELSRVWRRADGRRLAPRRGPSVGKLGRALRDGGLCDPSAAAPGPTFGEWLRDA